jgi:o-succinylbenzoate synthase
VKLVAARASLTRLTFVRPVVTSGGSASTRDTVIVALTDEDGRRGYGEAAPWPGFGTESAAEARAVLEAACNVIGGVDVTSAELLPPEVAPLLRQAPAARAALQGALCDLAARRAGLPLAKYLAAHRPSVHAPLREVSVSALLLERSPEALQHEAAVARAAGHRAAKIKLGGVSLAEDRRRAQAARDGLGPDVGLRGDANGAWTEHEARVALRALEEFDFDYIEQPVAAGAVEALAGLRGLTSIRIAADESVATEECALRLLESAAVDVFVLKPAMLGGPARALEIAHQARQAGCDVVFSHSFESAVGARHVLHCAAAWGDTLTAHGLCTAGLFATDVAEPVSVRDGVASVTCTPGLGIDL